MSVQTAFWTRNDGSEVIENGYFQSKNALSKVKGKGVRAGRPCCRKACSPGRSRALPGERPNGLQDPLLTLKYHATRGQEDLSARFLRFVRPMC